MAMAGTAPAPASAIAVHRIILRMDFIFRRALPDTVSAASGASYASAKKASIETWARMYGRCVGTSRRRNEAYGQERSQRADCGRNLSVSGAAGFMLAARRRAVRLINQNVIVTRGANHAVNRLAELIVRSAPGVLATRLFAADGHAEGSVTLMKTFYLSSREETIDLYAARHAATLLPPAESL